MSTYPDASNPSYDKNGENNLPQGISRPQNSWDPQEDRRRQIQDQIEASEDPQMERSARALDSLHESERMGIIATAEELIRQQGEQLDNIENMTGDSEQSLTTSQKHLSSVKSIFHGIKRWWQGDKEKTPVPASKQETKPSHLRNSMETSKEAGEQPVLHLLSEDCRRFNEEEDLDSRLLQESKKLEESSASGSILRSVTHSEKEKQTDNNFETFADALARLKKIAIELDEEIKKQNEQLG